MFGSKRKKIQVRSVEDYLKGEDARIPAAEVTVAPSSAKPPKAKSRCVGAQPPCSSRSDRVALDLAPPGVAHRWMRRRR